MWNLSSLKVRLEKTKQISCNIRPRGVSLDSRLKVAWFLLSAQGGCEMTDSCSTDTKSLALAASLKLQE